MLRQQRNSLEASNQDFSQRYFTWLWMAILCVGFWLRICSPHVSSLWLDEVLSVKRAALPDWATYVQVAGSSGHGPIYERLILRPWMLLGTHEFYLRFPSVLLGTLNHALVFVIGRRLLGHRVALLGGLVFALSAFHIAYTQETRPYVLAALFVALMFLFFVRVFWRNDVSPKHRFRDYGGYVLFASLALYSHYTTAFQLLTLALVGYGYIVFRREWRMLWTWSLMQIIILLSFLPWLSVFLKQFQNQPFSWIESRDFTTMFQFIPRIYWDHLVIDWQVLRLIFLTVIVVTLLVLLWPPWRRQRLPNLDAWILLGIVAWAPVFMVMALSLFWHPFFVPRYFLPVVTFAALFMGWILASALDRQRFLGAALLLLVSVSMFISAYGWTRTDWKEDWHGVVEYLEANALPDSVAILFFRQLSVPFEYYYQNPLPVRATVDSVVKAEQITREVTSYQSVWILRGLHRFAPEEGLQQIVLEGLPSEPVHCVTFGEYYMLELCEYVRKP